MDEFQLDKRPFFNIINSMIREDASLPEQERTDLVMGWVQKNRATIEKVCDREEVALFAYIVGYYIQYKNTPTRATCGDVVVSKQKPKAILDLLDDYDKQVDDLRKLSHLDLQMQLDMRIKDFEMHRLVAILKNAQSITMGAVDNPKGRDLPPLSGTKDALGYIMERFQRGVLVDDTRALGGRLHEHIKDLKNRYDKRREKYLEGTLYIPTGIPVIDNHMEGLSRQELNGVLGYTGQRKTAIIRTMAYNAALRGFNVLHIPLESDFEEELACYAVMHAHAGDFHGMSKLNRRRFDSGNMTDEEYTVFMTDVLANFAATVGQNLTVIDPKNSRTWAETKALIERENYVQPLDLVVVDYLTMLNDPSQRDQVAAKVGIIQDAKQLALNCGGHGFAMVTPVQGNRKGFEQAANQDGAWELSGISLYSEMDKSLDNCFYVYTNDEMAANEQLKIGTCKQRRGANIPATFVDINLNAGMVSGKKDDEVNVAASASTKVKDAPQPVHDDAFTYFSYL